MHSYEDIVTELITESVVERTMVFDYNQDTLAVIYDAFFQFCQQNLSVVSQEEGLNIEPARFYFRNNIEVNATAYCYEPKFLVISINFGTVSELHKLFQSKSYMDEAELADYRSLDSYLRATDQDVSIQYLMFQMALLFTYYHELGHLIQYTNSEFEGVSMSLDERYLGSDNELFDIKSHIGEYDADVHSANRISHHIFDFWTRLPEESQTELTLNQLITTSVSGVLGYILLLWSSSREELYFQKSDHPHPILRIHWILAVVLESVANKYPSFDQKAIIEEIFKIVNVFCRHSKLPDTKIMLREPMFKHYDKVLGYFAKVREMAEGEEFKYLAINTLHKKGR